MSEELSEGVTGEAGKMSEAAKIYRYAVMKESNVDRIPTLIELVSGRLEDARQVIIRDAKLSTEQAEQQGLHAQLIWGPPHELKVGTRSIDAQLSAVLRVTKALKAGSKAHRVVGRDTYKIMMVGLRLRAELLGLAEGSSEDREGQGEDRERRERGEVGGSVRG